MKPLLSLIILLMSASAAAQYPYDGISSPPLYNYYTYLEDPSGTIDADSALQLVNKRFIKWQRGVTFNKGITKNVFWFYLPVANQTRESQKAILKLSTRLNDVSLYGVDSTGHTTLLYTTNSYVPFDERPFPSRLLCFPLKLAPLEHKRLLLRVDNRGMGLYMPMYLQDVEKTLRAEQSRHWTYGIYFGVFLFIILFNLFLFFSMHDRIHLWYSAYVLSAILFMIQDEKFYTELYPAVLLPYFENAWVPPFSLLLMGTSLRVMQLFVDQRRDNSRWYPVTRFLAIGCFILSAGMLLLSLLKPAEVLPVLKKLYIVTDVFTALTMIVVVGSVIEKIIQKQKLAIYYLAAVLLMLFGALNYYFNHLGITNINVLKPNGVVVGLAFELTFLSFLLTLRYNNLKKEKEKLRAEQRKMITDEVIQAQEHERKRIAQDLHDDIGGTLGGLRLLTTNHFHQTSPSAESREAFQDKCLKLLNKAVSDIRSISHDLMPGDFAELGLNKSLSEFIEQLNTTQPIRFDYLFTGDEALIPKEMQLHVFRICNELVRNVIRHSNGTTATLQLILYEDYLQVQLEDDGSGFDTSKAKDGIGMKNVASRVKYLSGSLAIDSGKLGTTITIEIPFAVYESH